MKRSRPQAELLAVLAAERAHVLAAVGGLGEADLRRSLVPSGWTIAQLLHHLAIDDELFWIGAVLAGDPEAIAGVRDGWREPVVSGAAAIAGYRAQARRSDAFLATADLAAPPRWWPSPDVFGGQPFGDGYAVLHRVLVETATHAGHLDIVRELIDGTQHLVVD